MRELRPDATRRVEFDAFKRIPVVDIASAERAAFDVCPICLAPAPTSKEHVPPRQLGGRWMTMTCEPCNNRFGSHFERDLADWFHDRTGFSVARKEGDKYEIGGKMIVRKQEDGKPTFEMSGPLKPRIVEILQADDTQLRPRLPSYRAIQLAVLKSSYLAAVLIMGRIPFGPEFDAIRCLLVAARDSPRGTRWPHDELLANVRFSQTFLEPNGRVTLGISRQTNGDVELMVGLAGTVYARFPFSHSWTTDAARHRKAQVSLADVFESFIDDPSAWVGRFNEEGNLEFHRGGTGTGTGTRL